MVSADCDCAEASCNLSCDFSAAAATAKNTVQSANVSRECFKCVSSFLRGRCSVLWRERGTRANLRRAHWVRRSTRVIGSNTMQWEMLEKKQVLRCAKHDNSF